MTALPEDARAEAADADLSRDDLSGDDHNRLDIDVSVLDDRWAHDLGLTPQDLVGPIVQATLEQISGLVQSENWELSLVFADDAKLRDLNREYGHKDRPTNVLSFPGTTADDTPLPEGAARLLGDVVLARETVMAEASAQEKSPVNHTAHLLVHGLLHLLGHDHETEAEATVMEALERDILSEMGIADPYAAETRTEAGDL